MQLTWKNTLVFLLGIIILGSVLRFYDLGKNSFVADEFLDINSSYGYFKTGEWKAWDFNYGKLAETNINDARDERAFIYKWQPAQLFKFLPPTEEVARSVSVLWGMFTIVLMFWVAYFYTEKKSIGLLAALLFALSVTGIIFDRRLRMYAMFFPVFLAFATALFAFFDHSYKGKFPLFRTAWEKHGINMLYLLPVIVLGTISFMVHELSAAIFPIFGAYLLAMAAVTWKRKGLVWNKYTVLIGAGATAGVLAVLFLPKYVRLLTSGLVWFDNHYSYVGYILSDFTHPLLGALIACFGIFVLAQRLERRKEALFLTMATLVPLSMAIWLWRRNAGPQYIFFAQSFLLILTAVGVYGMLRFVLESMTHLGNKRVFMALVLIFLLLPNFGYFLEENNTYHETSSGGNPNYRKVFDYFKKSKQEGDVLITRNFRNYYFSGAQVPVYDFGGELSEKKFSLEELKVIMAKHPHGWVIVSENDYDYISNEAEVFFKKNMERVSNSSVRGAVEVYRW